MNWSRIVALSQSGAVALAAARTLASGVGGGVYSRRGDVIPVAPSRVALVCCLVVAACSSSSDGTNSTGSQNGADVVGTYSMEGTYVPTFRLPSDGSPCGAPDAPVF